MKVINRKFLFSFISFIGFMVFFFVSPTIYGQTVASKTKSTPLEIRFLSKIDEKTQSELGNLFRHPQKITGYKFNEDKTWITLYITDKVDPVDILQILREKGVNACYKVQNDEYITLEKNGRSTRRIYFKE